VPLKGLIEGKGRQRLTGMYDVVSKDTVYQSVNTNKSLDTSQQSFGKIKVCINADVNIKRVFMAQETTIPSTSASF